jgi:hypothetical protein
MEDRIIHPELQAHLRTVCNAVSYASKVLRKQPPNSAIPEEHFNDLIKFLEDPDIEKIKNHKFGTDTNDASFLKDTYLTCNRNLEFQDKIIAIHADIEKELKEKNKQLDDMLSQKKDNYDVVIIPDTILDLKKPEHQGWRVQISDPSKYEERKKRLQILLGVYGLPNQGKTFLINRLSNKVLAEGFNITTEGLSLKYAEHEGELASCLDTAGLNLPALFWKTC